ncbi:MAG: class I SAM-dependent methyltransferase [Burkholderiaceae bacterium]
MNAVSAWVRRWSHLVPPAGAVLDLACGRGRHARWFAQRGHPVTGVDQSAEALGALADLRDAGQVECVLADLENADWPLTRENAPRQFAGVVVTNYLWRALWPHILASVAPGGVLIYETFASGNETVGKPSRPDFLLQPGELWQRCADLRVVAYEEGFEPDPARYVQRIAAVSPLGRMQDSRFYPRL